MNGAVVTPLAVCGTVHRESYVDILMVARDVVVPNRPQSLRYFPEDPSTGTSSSGPPA